MAGVKGVPTCPPSKCACDRLQLSEPYKNMATNQDMDQGEHLKNQVLECLSQFILTSEEMWLALRVRMEKEGCPPPPIEPRRATEMERVRELHTILKKETLASLAVPDDPPEDDPMVTYPTAPDTALNIARNLLDTRPKKRAKTQREYAAALPPNRTGKVSVLYPKGSGLL